VAGSSMENWPVTSNSWVSSRPMEMSDDDRPMMGSPMARSAWANRSTSWSARHVARLEVHLGNAPVVAPDEAPQDLGQEAPLLDAQPAHDAVVHGDQVVVAVDEQVALVHVGMEEAVAHGVAQERLDDRVAEPVQVEAGCGRAPRRR
jgi:hypothetical protein